MNREVFLSESGCRPAGGWARETGHRQPRGKSRVLNTACEHGRERPTLLQLERLRDPVNRPALVRSPLTSEPCSQQRLVRPTPQQTGTRHPTRLESSWRKSPFPGA